MAHTIRSRRAIVLRRVAYTAIAAWILYGGYQFLKLLIHDDDRQPIVVNQGSIDFEVQEKDGERGRWKKDLLGGKWHVRHHMKPPTYMVVSGFAGTSCTGPYSAVKVELMYSNQSIEQTLWIDVSGTNAPPLGLTKHIKIDFRGADPEQPNDYTLRIPNPGGGAQVTLNSIVITNTDGSTQSCTFSGGTRGFTVDHRH